MPRLLIVADDLTGAADAASQFARAGYSTVVALRDDCDVVADVMSMTTNSRDLSRNAAIARVTGAVAHLPRESRTIIYKKMDSALRGFPAAELVATMRALGVRSVVVAPALPAEGRTTIRGRQLIGGKPIAESAFGRSGESSDLMELFTGEQPDVPVRLVDIEALRSSTAGRYLEDPGIAVFDAERDADLDVVATAALSAGIRLYAGSAGLASAIARAAPFAPERATPPLDKRWRGSILIVAGTRHMATAAQIAVAETRGAIVVRPDQSEIDGSASEFAPVIAEIERLLGEGRHVILTTAGLGDSRLGAFGVAERLATVIDSDAVQARIGGIVLTGGDVAAAVCAQAEASAIQLRGEVRPAIPWGTLIAGTLAGLPVVTKAGSFGPPETLLVCIDRLTSVRDETFANGD